MFERIQAKVLIESSLQIIRKKYSNKKIVFCTGCYDILQSGHAVFFNQCRELGDILVVGVGRDSTIAQLKGPGRPINPENNRLYLVAAMHDVDFAVLNDDKMVEGKIDFEGIVSKLRPDVFILNDDDGGIEFKKKLCARYGIQIEFVKRIVPEVLVPTSTSRIIDKINFSYKAPLRIDFAGGWTDVPFIMDGKKGYVSNVAIKPFIEYKAGKFNFSGYPRGSGLCTSTAAKLLEMISAKNYNVDSNNLKNIAEDLFNLENKELNWAIGRQDQYAIVYGGFNCFEFGTDYAKTVDSPIPRETLEEFRQGLLLLHTGISRNAQTAVEQVYQNYKTGKGNEALQKMATFGRLFHSEILKKNYLSCAEIMTANFKAQIELAPATTGENLDAIFEAALKNGALGGKICGAGGGGAFIFYCNDTISLKRALKKQFVGCFEIDFEFEYMNIKELNIV